MVVHSFRWFSTSAIVALTFGAGCGEGAPTSRDEEVVAEPPAMHTLGGTTHFDWGPSAASGSANRLDVYGVAANGRAYVRSWFGSFWSGWTPVPGATSLVGDIDAASASSSRCDVVARGVDGRYHRQTWTLNGWAAGWTSFANAWPLMDPAVAAPANDRLFVHASQYDVVPWTRAIYGVQESFWWGRTHMPPRSNVDAFGRTVGDRYQDHSIHVDTLGRMHYVREESPVYVSGQPWGFLNPPVVDAFTAQLPPLQDPRGFYGGPTICSWSAGRLDVFVRDLSRTLWHNYSNDGGTSWSSTWESVGGILASDPDCTSWGPNRIDVVGLGTDRAVWHLYYAGYGFSSWGSLGTP